MLADSYNGGLSAADVAAVVRNNNGNNYGCMPYGGMGYGMDYMWWVIILFLFNNNWGNNNMMPYLMANNGGCNCNPPATNADLQRGFDQQSLMNGISSLNSTTVNGFNDQAVSQCNQTTTLLTNLNNLGQQANQNRFDIVSTVTNANNNLSNLMTQYEMARQQCCCDNKMLIADLKSTIITEAANTRAAQDAGDRMIMDKLCQQQIDNLKEANANLRTENTLLGLTAAQQVQTQNLYNNNQEQTNRILDTLNPPVRPAYIVQNPNGCNCNCGQTYAYSNCGC